MATTRTRKPRRARRGDVLHKPSGVIHPRVQQVGPDHFGIVSIDCAKARSKWMLGDFFGKVLVPPTVVEHNRDALDAAVARVRQAVADHDLGDCLVAVERTGRYHRVVEHFRWSPDGLRILSLTATGRATVAALHLADDPDAIEVRSYWVLAGWHPPAE